MNRRTLFKRLGQAIACAIVAPYMALAPARPEVILYQAKREELMAARFIELAHYVNAGPLHADDPYGEKALAEFQESLGRFHR